MDILVLTSGVMSLVRGLYTFPFAKWVKPSLIYWSLSRTTIVEPLSALLITVYILFITALSAFLSPIVRLSVLDCE